jgi:small subunit ribosomal protein S15
MIARKKKQKVLALRAAKARDELTDQIDPVLGDYKPSAESSASGARAGRRASASASAAAAAANAKPSKWDQSLLKQVVVDRNEVWYSPPPQYPSSYDSAEVAGREFPFPAPVQPRYFSPILSSEADRQFLLRSVPEASVEIASSHEASLEAQGERMESETAKQLERSEMLMRALDLRNSDSRGIRVFNTQRIVTAFGSTAAKDGADGEQTAVNTGSTEVQAAILTHRIRMLAEHLTSNPRDVHNRKALRGLVMKRAGLLKYYKKRAQKKNGVGEQGYLELLDKLGLDRKAVEGEIVVR